MTQGRGEEGKTGVGKRDVIAVSRQQLKGHSLFADLHSFLI